MRKFSSQEYDAVIIGSGISGTCLARELSRYQLRIAVLEKSADFFAGATRGNSATVHSGHDASFGTRKAYYNVRGNAMYGDLCDELDVPFTRNGTLIIAVSDSDTAEVERMKKNADKNGVPQVRIVTPSEMEKIEGLPFGREVRCGLYAPSGGMVSPYDLAFALSVNAADNGVSFFKNAEVRSIVRSDGGFLLSTSRGDLRAKAVFNCAGTHADEINNMVCPDTFRIIPRKGEHIILDKVMAPYVRTTQVQTPFLLPGGGHTKGMGIQPSVDGTIILGCDARNVGDKDDASTTKEGKDAILSYFRENWRHYAISSVYPEFPERLVISSFGGLRPHPEGDDFIVGGTKVPGFFNMAGIESPGLTAAPAIAADVAAEAAEAMRFRINPHFNPERHVPKPFRDMSEAERAEAIRNDPDYGKLVCRCELVTRAEVLRAVRGPESCPELGADSVNAVKMRTRAGMGRCQGGFCGPEVAKILSEAMNISMMEVTQRGGRSRLFTDRVGDEHHCGGNPQDRR